MDNTLTLLDEGDIYRLKKLILVNSGSCAYVEIPIDESSALLSKNNKGKTSALNALKLFLLPEVNFRNCEKKFEFKSAGKVYTGIESYNYYFPCDASFLILEAENVHGQFCIVLHQSREELGYGRINVPHPYEAIRHLFWDYNSSANQGLGQHPPGLSLAEVTKSLLDLGGRLFTDSESIRTAMFTRVNPARPETRFCIVPTVQPPGPSLLKSIKAMLQLSFDIKGADTANLPLAMANIIDSEISINKKSINIDIKGIHEEREQLRREADLIQAIKNNMDHWKVLKSSEGTYQSERIKAHRKYWVLKESIQAIKEGQAPKQEQLNGEKTGLEGQLNGAKSARKAVSESLTGRKSSLGTVRNDLKSIDRRIATSEEAIKQTSLVCKTTELSQIISYLNDVLSETREELTALKSREEANQALQSRLDDKKSYQTRLAQLTEQLQDNKKPLLGYLPSHSATVLHSLNPGFQRLTGEPMSKHIDAINEFSLLFEVNSDQLEFIGEPLPSTPIKIFDADRAREEAEWEKEDLTGKLKTCDDKITKLNRFIKSSGPLTQEMVANKQAEITAMESELTCLHRYEGDMAAREEKRAQEFDLQSEIAELEEELAEANAHHHEIMQAMAELQEKLNALEQQQNKVRDTEQELRLTERSAPELPKMVKATILERELITDYNALADEHGPLQRSMTKYRDAQQEAERRYRQLTQAGIIEVDPETLHQVSLDSEVFAGLFSRLRSEFENLAKKEQEHQVRISNHNHKTSAELGMLDSMGVSIESFEKRINETLAGVKISNLTGVKIKIETLEAFNVLRRELKDYRVSSTDLKSDSFYRRLLAFSQEYLVSSRGQYAKLDLERIITGVDFIYEINGQEETTSQSNGTNGMVNAVLLSILMRRLVPEDVTFTLPVVFDEIGSLDEDNLPELRRVVEQNRFVLLVANPNNNGYIAEHIGRWHDIYLQYLTEGTAVGKCHAVYLSEEESLTVIPPTAMEEETEEVSGPLDNLNGRESDDSRQAETLYTAKADHDVVTAH
ncbi:hypothetical protein [Microbulbifer magnicolonia]|uniref:hypothetical protein n=1 Tax=Microbulbifer magnicolonia TaxID=3109744 RepID=UPI002B409830|nr:hypothetical protein [Microbulbifer sp. GG15]